MATNDFFERLKARQRAAAFPEEKPVGEMSEAELEGVIQRTKREIRNLEEQEAEASREAIAAEDRHLKFLPARRRRPWK